MSACVQNRSILRQGSFLLVTGCVHYCTTELPIADTAVYYIRGFAHFIDGLRSVTTRRATDILSNVLLFCWSVLVNNRQ